MRGSIRRRIEDLERQAPELQQPPSEVSGKLREFLEGYAIRKATGTLTEEDEASAATIKAEIERRRDAGKIGGGGW